jgi:hypothetical protein
MFHLHYADLISLGQEPMGPRSTDERYVDALKACGPTLAVSTQWNGKSLVDGLLPTPLAQRLAGDYPALAVRECDEEYSALDGYLDADHAHALCATYLRAA